MHSFLVLPVLLVAVLAQVPYYQRQYVQHQVPYSSRPSYPLNYHLVQRPVHAVQRPAFHAQRPVHTVQRPVHHVQSTVHHVQRPVHAVQRPVHIVQSPVLPSHEPVQIVHQQQQPVHVGQQPGFPATQSGGQVHHSRGGSDYHYSWRVNGDTYTWGNAQSYCKRLPGGWDAISIETHDEDSWVKSVLTGENQKYIWTSGSARPHPHFVWSTGQPSGDLDWSHTGSLNSPQPDNAENNNENCLAVLNNFYQDGVRWHDVGCHHLKPIICERRGSHF
ncbi:uncharacterized protein LOC143017806 [Oratosquilla oratoria]|uniref:uncharacterized protein LOC143017806 n=1 Tax=Oratosquilla oratoria TaxID=337810 RepID=UPI003F76EB02